jgi:hypothetical protein
VEVIAAENAVGIRKSALDHKVQDASAALPQNCQTTIWILESASICVNVTLVMNSVELTRSPMAVPK